MSRDSLVFGFAFAHSQVRKPLDYRISQVKIVQKCEGKATQKYKMMDLQNLLVVTFPSSEPLSPALVLA